MVSSLIFFLGLFLGIGVGVTLSMFSVWIGMNRISRDSLEAWRPQNLGRGSKGEILDGADVDKVERVAGRFWEEVDERGEVVSSFDDAEDSV